MALADTTRETPKGPKEIDEMDVKDLGEMAKVFDLHGEELKTMEGTKSLIKRKITANTTANRSPGEASTIVSNAKWKYDEKRKSLLESYTSCKEILTEACKEFPVLQEFIGNFEKRIDQLKQRESFLFVTGETSAGKSDLINLLLNDEILPTGHVEVTSTIWEIKYGQHPKIKAHLKSKDPETEQPTKEIFLEDPSDSKSSGQSYLEQISPFVSENESRCKKIELFLPHSLLQQGIVIVDTPGLGESQDLDDLVYQYLPQVFAFIFVLTAANSDGTNKNTIRKLFETVKKVFSGLKDETGENSATTFPIEEGMYGREMMQDFLLSECSLFVSNKWDAVKEDDVQDVENKSITKLKKYWPGFDSKSQFFRISVKYARIAQQYKAATDEFHSLVNGLERLVTKCINARLELDWRWLNNVLSFMVAKTKTSRKTNSLNLRNAKEEIKKLNDALNYIENHKKEKMKEVYRNFDTFEMDAVKRLRIYLSSKEVIAQFSSWTEQEVPPANRDWEKTKRSIETAFDSRLHKTLQLWLEKDGLMARAEWFLNVELKRVFDVPDHLKSLPDDNEGDSLEINSPFRMKENSSYAGLTIGGTFALLAVGTFYLGPFASLVARVGVTAIPATLSALGLTLEGIERLEARWQKSEFEENRKAFMSKHSKDVLVFVRENRHMPEKIVKFQLKRVKQYLSTVRNNLSKLIPAERKELSKFENKERSLEKVQNDHKRICEEGCRLRGLHAVLGIKEMCPMIQISSKALKWNDDFSSRIGSGAFGDVFEGKMRITQEESKTVALKVYKKELDDKNASEIMDEIEMLRKLNGHSHIVQFHGISFHHGNVVLIFEKCSGSLADKIFISSEEKTLVPESTKLQWAREIIDGMFFIHAQGVVHRDLKPENILLSEENRIKIADVGLAKPKGIVTGTVAGTYSYMAPEVFDSNLYDTKADIYSLGIVLWEMWYGRHVYQQWSGTVQEFFDGLKKGNRPEHKGSSDEPPWKDLMMKCWDGNPETRPTACECKEKIESVCMIQEKVV